MTIVAIVFVVALIVLGLAGYIEKWLWMRQLDYVGIFWTVLSVQCAMGVLAFALVFGFLWLNLRQAVKGDAASLRAAQPWGSALPVGARFRQREASSSFFRCC